MGQITNDVELLKIYASNLGEETLKVANILLDDERFPIWCGGINTQHHSYIHSFSV